MGFLEAPGQGMSYVVGRQQLLSMLEAARLADGFDLQAFHRGLLENGNLPFALQAHAAGLHNVSGAPSLPPALENLHSAFDGVPAARRPQAPEPSPRMTVLDG